MRLSTTDGGRHVPRPCVAHYTDAITRAGDATSTRPSARRAVTRRTSSMVAAQRRVRRNRNTYRDAGNGALRERLLTPEKRDHGTRRKHITEGLPRPHHREGPLLGGGIDHDQRLGAVVRVPEGHGFEIA